MAKMYFRYGAMTCGKTTALLQVAHNYEINGMHPFLIKPLIDKKGADTVVSRLGISRKVDLLLGPKDLISNKLDVKGITCIIVDEVQFLNESQIYELWLISKIYDIPVICYGLKTNFKGELFEGSKALLEKADEIEELATICSCGKKAKFNARVENGEFVFTGKEVAIDGIDATYKPLCGECYVSKVLKYKIKKVDHK